LFFTYYRDKYSSLGEFTAYIVIVLMQDVGRDGMKACELEGGKGGEMFEFYLVFLW
jgi:hypothetical protein